MIIKNILLFFLRFTNKQIMRIAGIHKYYISSIKAYHISHLNNTIFLLIAILKVSKFKFQTFLILKVCIIHIKNNKVDISVKNRSLISKKAETYLHGSTIHEGFGQYPYLFYQPWPLTSMQHMSQPGG